MKAPTATALLAKAVVLQAMEKAWADSNPGEPARRHEEGGWVYADTATGELSVRRAPAGGQALLDVRSPPVITGFVVVATFHTHPNPTAEGWDPRPSPGDTQSAWLLGVPCLVRADDGVYVTGPESRRGGMSGPPGFPG